LNIRFKGETMNRTYVGTCIKPWAWRYLQVSRSRSTHPVCSLFDDHVAAVSGDAKGQVLEVQGSLGRDVGFYAVNLEPLCRRKLTLTESKQYAVYVPPQHEHRNLWSVRYTCLVRSRPHHGHGDDHAAAPSAGDLSAMRVHSRSLCPETDSRRVR